MLRDVRWGFLGVGRVTERMVTAIRSRPGHHIQIAAGRDPDKLRSWGQRHQVDRLTQNLQEVIDASDIDIVYVALPPSLHAEWTTRALQAGKRVLCEKPLTLNEASCAAMIQVSRECSVPLSHATGFVHHPRSHAMRAIVRSGELGSIQRVTVACTFSMVADREHDHRFDPHAGGGCLLDLGWYCAFATLWFTGLQPLAIKSFGNQRGHGSDAVWNQVQTIARLEGGATASWDCGYDAAGRKWIEISGSRGSLICDDFLRPWDLEKPRYWVHGQDGKARAELVGEGVLQESWMIENAARAPLAATLESLEMAKNTQKILEQIDTDACNTGFTYL